MSKRRSFTIVLFTLFLILSIIVISIIGYFIYNLSNKNLTKSNDSTNHGNTTAYEISGSYVIEINNNLLDESAIFGDEAIQFLGNNKFTAYVGWGNSVHGTYTINDNIINCTISSASGEYSPEQLTQATLSFRVLDNSTLEIIEVSETYKIKITELSDGEWVLTEETKDMPLSPFIKGIRFNLEKTNQ